MGMLQVVYGLLHFNSQICYQHDVREVLTLMMLRPTNRPLSLNPPTSTHSLLSSAATVPSWQLKQVADLVSAADHLAARK